MSAPVAASAVGLALVLGAANAAAGGLTLADAGRASVEVRVARDAIAAERTAASELATYLERVTGARFAVVAEDQAGDGIAAIHVGPTARVRERVPDLERWGPEDWGLRCRDGELWLYGGRPRGTLYAVFHFLEDRLGVGFWTPWAEDVPRVPRLVLPAFETRGRPAFSYRDVHGLVGALAFRARRRENGMYSQLPPAWGGRHDYGPPFHVHTAYLYVDPDEHFATRPELFSEIGGLRYAGEGQLCLSAEGLLDIVLQRLRGFVAQARREAQRTGEPEPRVYDLSANDWGRACECAACAGLAAAEGSAAAPWVAFLNRLADRVAEEFPELFLDTLAYHHTFRPPRTLRLRDNVIVRWSALHQRDFSRPLSDPVNRACLESLDGWLERARHVRVWDYALLWGDQGELPLPNLPVLAQDLRLYRARGIDGVFVQVDDPVGSDLWDLKHWTVSRLLEDPQLDLNALVREFTDGYYGASAPAVRRYLRSLERAAARRTSVLRYRPEPEDHRYLEGAWMAREQARFDRAEARAAADPERVRRLRHARLALDRATLALEPRMGSGFDRRPVVERFRSTWREQLTLRLGPAFVEPAMEEVERELAFWERRRPTPAP